MEPSTVVIDNGTGYTKMGYAGNMEPSYLIPSVIATSFDKVSHIPPPFLLISFLFVWVSNSSLWVFVIKRQGGATGKSLFNNPELDFYIGEEAQKKTNSHYVRSILKSGQISDWEGIERFWHKSIYQYLRCEPDQHRFILTEPPMNTPENRE